MISTEKLQLALDYFGSYMRFNPRLFKSFLEDHGLLEAAEKNDDFLFEKARAYRTEYEESAIEFHFRMCKLRDAFA